MEKLIYKTVSELSNLLCSNTISAVELSEAFLIRIEKVEDKIGAFIHYDRNDILLQARASDNRRKYSRSLGPLDGIPISIKDIIAVKNQPLTCASKMLENFISPYDSHVSELLKKKGAVLFGRLNMDEFAIGSCCNNSALLKTANPWNLKYIPGGSSGGSAAAVAAGEVPITLGSDTGGSIRQPASYCGVIGLKPTYGLVSRYGLTAYVSSFDQIGPIGKSIEDIAIVLQVIAGYDLRDSTSIRTAIPDYRFALNNNSIKQYVLGVPREYFTKYLDNDVRSTVETAIHWYAKNGYEIIEVSLPHTDLGISIYYTISTAEASSNLSRYDGIRYGRRIYKVTSIEDFYTKNRITGLGSEVKYRILLGSFLLSDIEYNSYYNKAKQACTLIKEDFARVYQQCDALLTPVTQTTAFNYSDDINHTYLLDIFTMNVNIAGLPAISLPCGFSKKGLPIGLQIIGKPLLEHELLAIAYDYELDHNWKYTHPIL